MNSINSTSFYSIIGYAVIICSFLTIQLFHLNGMALTGIISFILANASMKWKTDWPALKYWLYSLVALSIVLIIVVSVNKAGISMSKFIGGYQDVLNRATAHLNNIEQNAPPSIKEYIPDDAILLVKQLAHFLRNHAKDVALIGKSFFESFFHIILGIIIGVMIAFQHDKASSSLSKVVVGQLSRFVDSFKILMFAQVKISAINTVLTGIFIFILVPVLFGEALPGRKTIIAITFMAGILPIVGNVISNTAIFLSAISISLGAASIGLAFLVGIHKIEYLLNAKIASDAVKMKPYEVLLAIVLSQILFGATGVLLSLVFVIYAKEELRRNNLIQ